MDHYTIKPAYLGDLSEKYNEVEISSENLLYVELQDTHSGVQCLNPYNEEEIMKRCKQISKLIKEIDQLNIK